MNIEETDIVGNKLYEFNFKGYDVLVLLEKTSPDNKGNYPTNCQIKTPKGVWYHESKVSSEWANLRVDWLLFTAEAALKTYIKDNAKKIRYIMQGADEAGLKGHPQEVMQGLGYKLFSAEPITIADCWIFEVEEVIEPLPSYLKEI